jgi:hypothetical protein
MGTYKFLRNNLPMQFFILTILTGLHLLLLVITKFTDWPEIILYPWFVKQGMGLYRDTYIAYPPVSVWLLSLWFNLAGFTITAYRTAAYVIIIANDILIYLISIWLWKKKSVAVSVCLLYILLQVPLEGNGIWHELMYLPLMLVSYVFLCKYISSASVRYLIFSGVIIGLAFIIKQTAFWPLAAVSVFIAFYHRRFPLIGFKRMMLFLIPSVIFFTAVWVYYFFRGSVNEYIYWIILYPLSLVVTRTSYGYLPSWKLIIQIAAMYVPLLFAGFLFSKKYISPHRWYLLLSMAFCTGLLITALPRWGIFRFQPSLGFMVLVTGFVISGSKRIWTDPFKKIVFLVILIPSVLLSSRYIFWFYLTGNAKTQEFMGAKQLRVAYEIKTVVDGQSFYLMGGTYDYMYFLMQKKPYILPWTQHFPWMLDTAKLYQSIITRLENQKIHYVVLNTSETPVQFSAYITQAYDRTYTLSDGGAVFRRR